MNIKWIIQRTLAGQKTLDELTRAITTCGAIYELITVVPFDPDIQYTPTDDSLPIVYGSSTFMYGSYNHPYLRSGVFFHPDRFLMSRYLRHWGANMLNADGRVVAIKDLAALDIPGSREVFVRPDSDSKAFSGMVCSMEEILQRFSQTDGSNPYLQLDTQLFLSSVKEIENEWRCFIVEGKVVSASRYRVFGETLVDRDDIPQDMLSFAEAMCSVFVPHDVFVMDVGLCEGSYKIIECNCFNGTGAYEHDWCKIAGAVHAYVERHN